MRTDTLSEVGLTSEFQTSHRLYYEGSLLSLKNDPSSNP